MKPARLPFLFRRIIAPLALLAAAVAAAPSTACAQPSPRKADRAPSAATILPVSENWRLSGDVPVHALLLSLQGLANRDQARLYLEYPRNWQWEIVHPLIGFLEKRHGIAFDRLGCNDAASALARFAKHARGCVIWDKAVRSSLIVAFTVAGVEDAVIVNEDLLPLAEKAGLRPLVDLRGTFRGMTDAQIYQWAYDRYWKRCSRDYYVVLGGECGDQMQPGIADFGIMQRAFFSDLSSNPKHVEELALLKRILGAQNPASIVLGWHSYAKDTEGQHTALTGSFGLKMEGLHNLPNVSFTCQIPLTPDFKFQNNHTARREAPRRAEKKVYIAAVSTDSMGIGAWTKPGRGRIPYAWQVLMNWAWMNPPALQFFYESRTPNDYFIAGLSGPGYMYPKAIPPDRFPALMKDARSLMRLLDLRVMEIMDFSEFTEYVSIADLPKPVVDRYYDEFPDVIGFINGYYTAGTFDLRDNRPFISYDYYLGVGRPVPEAIADLDELIQLNPQRPYFLLMHVRERNTVEMVATVLQGLCEPAEVVPLDVFLQLAAGSKTYRTRYQQPSPRPAAPSPKSSP